MSDVVSLDQFKQSKKVKENLARGRDPLYMSHRTGKISGHSDLHRSEDFGDRVSRIRASIEKINDLMKELKRMSERDKNVDRS